MDDFNRNELNSKLMKEFGQENQDESEVFDNVPPSKMRLNLKLFYILPVIIIICLVFIAISVYKNYFIESDNVETPIVRFDGEDIKIKPEDPGGIRIPNMDKDVYDNIATSESKQLPKVEKILPRAEEPMPRVEIREVVKVESVKKEEVKVDKVVEQVKKDLVDSSDLKKITLSEKNIKTSANKIKKVIPKLSSTNRIQLGSYRNIDDVKVGWKRLKKKYPEVLGSLSLYYEKADLGSRGLFYRLQAGPFDSEGAARRACSQLNNAKQGCFFVKVK